MVELSFVAVWQMDVLDVLILNPMRSSVSTSLCPSSPSR